MAIPHSCFIASLIAFSEVQSYGFEKSHYRFADCFTFIGDDEILWVLLVSDASVALGDFCAARFLR